MHCVFPSQDFFRDSSWFFWKSAAAAHKQFGSFPRVWVVFSPVSAGAADFQCKLLLILWNFHRAIDYLPVRIKAVGTLSVPKERHCQSINWKYWAPMPVVASRSCLVWNVTKVNTSIWRIKVGASTAGCVGCLSRAEGYISLLRWWMQLSPLNLRMKLRPHISLEELAHWL